MGCLKKCWGNEKAVIHFLIKFQIRQPMCSSLNIFPNIVSIPSVRHPALSYYLWMDCGPWVDVNRCLLPWVGTVWGAASVPENSLWGCSQAALAEWGSGHRNPVAVRDGSTCSLTLPRKCFPTLHTHYELH